MSEIPATAFVEAVGVASASGVYNKISLRLLPFLSLCLFVSALDRVNVSFAKLQMLDQLHFSEAVYGFGAGIFFVGYILFEVPSNAVLQRVSPPVWIGRIMIGWGLVSAGMMVVTSSAQFYVMRFLLGMGEAGGLPGILFYLTAWFPSHQRGRATSRLMLGGPLAGVLGGPLSGWIMRAFDQSQGLSGWQWVFLLEALPSIALGLAAMFLLPRVPAHAGWLTESEKRCSPVISPPIHWPPGRTVFSTACSICASGFWAESIFRSSWRATWCCSGCRPSCAPPAFEIS